MCCDLNRAIPQHAWWWLVVAGCLRCMCVRHLFRSYLQPPPHLLFLLSADLRVAVGAATDPYYHPLVLPRHQPTLPAPPMPTLRCPAATDLVVLLRSYLQPPHPLFLHSTRLRVAMGCAAPSLPPPYYPYPVASSPCCRLLCLCCAALQPTVTHPTAAPQRLSPLFFRLNRGSWPLPSIPHNQSCLPTCWLRKKIPPHLALRERNKQIQKLVQFLT